MRFYKLLSIIFISIFILSCSEKTTYSGKIISDQDISNIKIKTKSQLIEKFGEPSYIDTLQNTFFYFTEKNKTQNFYKKNKEYSYLFIFEIDKNENVISSKAINLLDKNSEIFNKAETPNDIINRGLIEKIFGGVGPNNKLPNSQ